jgi:hypothetical protein
MERERLYYALGFHALQLSEIYREQSGMAGV